MGTLKSELILSLIDRITGPIRGPMGALQRLNAAAARNAAAINQMGGQFMGAVGAGYALARGLSSPIQAAIDFESAMADVRKVVDFSSAEGFARMGKDIREMSLRIPIAADGLAQIVAAAGQSGIANDELTKFAEMAAKVGVAWDITAGEAGEAMAKLKTALGRSVEDTGKLADAINHLGNNSAASAPQILAVVRRVAPMASQFGMTAEQVAAIGAAMTGAGFEAEVAATSLLNVGRALTKGGSATARQSAVFKKLGLSAKTVAQSMQKNAVGTLQDVLTRINKLPAATRAAAISDLFGDEARALGPLISNGTLLAETLALISDESKYAGSAANEYTTASQRTANALQLFKNRVTDLGVSIGDALLPPLNSFLEKIGPIVTDISDLAQRYPNLTRAIVGTTAALIGFNVALTATRFAFLWMKGGLISTAIVGLKGLSAATKALAAPLLARSAISSASALLAQRQAAYASALALQNLARSGGVAGVTLKQATSNVAAAGQSLVQAQLGMKAANAAFGGMAASVPGLSAIGGALSAIGAALATISAPAWLAIGAGMAVVAGAGLTIWQNWDRVSSTVAGVARAIGDELKPVIDLLQPVLDPFAQSFRAIGDAAGWAGSKMSELGSWLSSLFGQNVLTPQHQMAIEDNAYAVTRRIIAAFKAANAALVQAGAEMIQSLWDGMLSKVDALIEWVKTIPQRIKGAIGNIDLGSSIRSLVGLGGGGGEGVDGKRALGGPVRAGGTYVVGERGPELFRPGASGRIEPHAAYRSAMAGPSSVSSSTSGPGDIYQTISPTINVYGASDAHAVAREVMALFGQEVKGAVEAADTD